MKMIMRLLAFCCLLIFSGCLDVTEEITINEDESGIYSNISDMSAAIGMMKLMAGEEAKEMEELSMDTTISISDINDSIAGLSAKDLDVLRKGKIMLNIDLVEEVMKFGISVPYSSLEEFNKIKEVVAKSSGPLLASQLSSMLPSDGASEEGEENMMPAEGMQGGDISAYFDMQYAHGRITKKIIEEKYAEKDQDQGLQSISQMIQMGTPMTVRTIINLPRPASKVDGSNVTLSDDKRQVIIENSLQDFFDEPSKFEFDIRY